MIIRTIQSTEDIKQVAGIEMATWGEKPEDTVPDHVLTAISREGGVLLGAYQEDLLIGFTLGWLGTYDSESPSPASHRLKLVSHMTAVLSEYRDQRIGYQLKLAQREWALEQGLDLITWTYDPLESRNGNFNIGLLGCTCQTYLRNYYGEMSDSLSRGLPSDRFRADWWITSLEVRERLEGGSPRSIDLGSLLDDGAQLVNPPGRNSSGFYAPPTSPSQITAPKLLVEIPTDYQQIRQTDLDLALSWRISIRNIFEQCFDLDYQIRDYLYQRSPEPRSFYLLEKTHEN